MTSVHADMLALAARLNAAGVNATADPNKAVNSKGAIVLVPPPTRDFTTLLQTWNVAVMAPSHDSGLATTKKLSDLFELLHEEIPEIEEARPGSVLVVRDQPPYPAYIARFTTP